MNDSNNAIRRQVAEEIAAAILALSDPDTNSRGLHLGLRMSAQIALDVGATDVDPDRWVDLDRLRSIKWGDKVIDAREVVYINGPRGEL